jgi:ankyrin repeat protein
VKESRHNLKQGKYMFNLNVKNIIKCAAIGGCLLSSGSLWGTEELDQQLRDVAGKGDANAVQKLLDDGANPNAKGKLGWTALHHAAGDGRTPVVEALLKRPNIEVNARDKHKNTPLHLAAEWGRGAVVPLLLGHPDIEVNARDRFNDTPLHRAARMGYDVDIVRQLLPRVADVNAQNDLGRTALHHAVERGNVKIVETLLAADGIDVNARNKKGKTPLDYANKQAIEDLLRQHGAKKGAELIAEERAAAEK